MSVTHRFDRARNVGTMSGHDAVGQASQGIQVGPGALLPGLGSPLLGRHVVWGAQKALYVLLGVDAYREPKVGQL